MLLRSLPVLLAGLLLLPSCTRPAAAQRAGAPPALVHEFRGVWVATVENIDWPSRPGLSSNQARAELDTIVARAVELRLNAIVFQVRPAGDAMYASELEPWSEWLTGAQGRAPDVAWDPLQYLIAKCHREGLQLHAWFNPYRAAHPSGRSATAKNHVLAMLPSACVDYGANRWMDPGDERAAEWSLAVIRDVVARYDVDGVHIDDYFYPYPVKGKDFPDQRSYARYQQAGGKLKVADWRRANIDTFVRRMYEIVHRAKPWVMVGISPFGIARPGVPAGIKGLDQYGQLYADVLKWLREGWVDYLSPQLYWPIDQAPQSFAVLLPWWHTQNPQQRHLWPGINPGRALRGEAPWRREEIADQLGLLRAQNASQGHVHYSFKALRTDAPNVGGALKSRLYGQPVLAPASEWLGAERPKTPVARVEGTAGRRLVAWQPDPTARFVVVQTNVGGTWITHRIVGGEVGSCTLPTGTTAVAVTAASRTGVLSAAAMPVLR